MTALLLLVVVGGLMPLAAALMRLQSVPGTTALPPLGSVLLCALAFNLTFAWQELWLVLPKALVPGLSPVLYHNDHGWSGTAPVAELLQGTGAIATLVSGVGWTVVLARSVRGSATWQTFVFWLASEGWFQALSQLALGSVLPGNDVGRALAFLHFGPVARATGLVASLAGMAFVGGRLASLAPPSLAPDAPTGSRAWGWALLTTVGAAVILAIPFRVPRSSVEVVAIPAIVHVFGLAWLLMSARPVDVAPEGSARPNARVAAGALLLLLLLLQGVLRRGVAF